MEDTQVYLHLLETLVRELIFVSTRENTIITRNLTKTYKSNIHTGEQRFLFPIRENRIVTAIDHVTMDGKKERHAFMVLAQIKANARSGPDRIRTGDLLHVKQMS